MARSFFAPSNDIAGQDVVHMLLYSQTRPHAPTGFRSEVAASRKVTDSRARNLPFALCEKRGGGGGVGVVMTPLQHGCSSRAGGGTLGAERRHSSIFRRRLQCRMLCVPLILKMVCRRTRHRQSKEDIEDGLEQHPTWDWAENCSVRERAVPDVAPEWMVWE